MLGLSAQRAREQQPARQRRAARGRDLDGIEAEADQQIAQRTRCVEVEVVAERIAVAGDAAGQEAQAPSATGS